MHCRRAGHSTPNGVLESRGHVEAGQDPRLVLAGQASAGMTIAGLVVAYLADPEKAALRSRDEGHSEGPPEMERIS
jgi:hypothetical protein